MFGREEGPRVGAGGETGGQAGGQVVSDVGGLVCGGDVTSLARVEFASGTGSDKDEILGKMMMMLAKQPTVIFVKRSVNLIQRIPRNLFLLSGI